jgi:PPOX class probable F420-dependent enzyme
MSWSWDEVVGFIAEEPRIGRLATASEDGEPHVGPIWFHVDGTELQIHTMLESRKAKSIMANGKFALTVDKEDAPYKGVTMRGEARVAAENEIDWFGLVRQLAVRYLGTEMGTGYGEYIAGTEGAHTTLVITPSDWETWDYSQG